MKKVICYLVQIIASCGMMLLVLGCVDPKMYLVGLTAYMTIMIAAGYMMDHTMHVTFTADNAEASDECWGQCIDPIAEEAII